MPGCRWREIGNTMKMRKKGKTQRMDERDVRPETQGHAGVTGKGL